MMRRTELQFTRDTIEMAQLFYEPSMHKTAQENLSGILGSIEGYVKKSYDPNNKVESTLSFLAPGILWVLGFRWIAVIYELAQAFGFDWTHFFSSIKEKLRPFLQGLTGDHQGDASTISSIVESAVEEASSNSSSPDKLIDVVEKHSSFNNLLFIKKTAIRYQTDDNLMHKIERWLSSAAGNRMRKGVLGFIIRIMSWVITAALVSAGFAIAGGIVSQLIGSKKKEEPSISHDPDNAEHATNTDKNHPQATQQPNQIKLFLNHQADSNLFSTTFNDDSHVWLLNFNINTIKDHLIKWAQELYPQLTDGSAFDASSKFQDTLKMFRDRNKDASQVEILAVPEPFNSIKSIVDRFALDVATHTKQTENNEPIEEDNRA